MRRTLAQDMFRFPDNKIRVIADNVGGGFGMKGGVLPGISRSPLLAAKLTRPAGQVDGRPQRSVPFRRALPRQHHRSRARARQGRKVPRLRVRNYCNIGAYNGTDRSAGPPTNNIGVLAGTYTFPVSHVEVNGTFTNTMLTGHYRGAGRPEAAYVLETMVDLAARKLGIDPAELRRRNTIPVEAMPYKTALVYTYDCGDFGKNLDDCLADGGLRRVRDAPPANRAKRGKLRGIGISNTVEASNAGLIEHAELRFDPVRRADGRDGHARPRPGPRHRVPPDRRRQARHSARPRALSSTATPIRSRSAPAPSARARWSAAAPRC